MAYLIGELFSVSDVLREVLAQGMHRLPLDHYCLKHDRRQGTRNLALKCGDLQSLELGIVLNV